MKNQCLYLRQMLLHTLSTSLRAVDTEGRYGITSIPVGVYSVRFLMVGHEENAVTDKESFTIFPSLPVLGVSARF